MERREYIVMVGGSVPLVSGAVSADEHNTDEEDDGDEEDEETSMMEVGEDELYSINGPSDLERTPFESNVLAEFEGEGSEVTEEFELEEGLTVLAFESENLEDEGIEGDLDNLDGDDDETWAINEVIFSGDPIDEVTGASLVRSEGGEYLIDIDTDGSWTVHVAQPRAPEEEIRTPPVSVEGIHSTVIGPLESDGGMTVTGEFRGGVGDYSFDVRVEEADPSGFLPGEYAFTGEEPGFEGQTRVDVEGVTWTYISTMGEWSLRFE